MGDGELEGIWAGFREVLSLEPVTRTLSTVNRVLKLNPGLSSTMNRVTFSKSLPLSGPFPGWNTSKFNSMVGSALAPEMLNVLAT